MRNLLTEPIYVLKDEGFFNEFSEEHFLMKLLDGKCDIFTKYREKFGQSNYQYVLGKERNDSFNFLTNFAKMIHKIESIIDKKDLKKFFDDQLSAGKENYDEDQFFRALSEMHIIKFITTFHDVNKVLYEPPLGKNGANPEFRAISSKGYVYDIEVKTPGFNNKKYNNPVLKPNLILSESKRRKIQMYCKENNLDFEYPRVLKIKDFINSCGHKFVKKPCENNLNILMVNWTYNDFHESNIKEPVTVLCNPVSGVFYNEEAAESIGVNIDALNKIDAIVVYRDNINTILFSDFRYNFELHSYRCLINPKNLHKDKRLFDILTMKPDNKDYVDWYPADYKNVECLPIKVINKHSTYILKCLYEDIEHYKKLDKEEVDNKMRNIELFNK